MSSTMMYFSIVILMISSWLIGNTITLIILFIRENIRDIKLTKDNNKEFKSRMKTVEKMKAAGDFHKWINIPIGMKEVMVCSNTGYCPAENSFISLSYVKKYEAAQKREEEYIEFKKERMAQLSDKYGISLEETERLVEQVFEIKKDFTIKKLADLQDELSNDEKSIEDGKKAGN